MKKIILIAPISIIAIASLYFFIPTTRGEKNVYYQSGELIIQEGKQILVAPNGREIEFIEIAGNDKLIKKNEIEALGSPYQVLIKETLAGTYAIVLEGDFISYYNISDLNNATLIKKLGPFWKNYDYYYDIAPYTENKFITAGEKGITIWNTDTLSILEKIYNKRTDNVESYNSSIYSIGEEGVIIFNAERREIRDPYIKTGKHQHQIFVDDIGTGYFPGDDVLKLRTYTSYKNMSHPSQSGNAIAGFYKDSSIYFANGWNVYKASATDLKIIKTIPVSRKKNEWGAGIKAFDLSQGKRLVIFNGNNILLADENLNILDEYEYLPITAKLFNSKTMRVSPVKGFSGNSVIVAANGFWPGEDVSLKFEDKLYELKSNNAGEIEKVIEVPKLPPCKTPILTTGKLSGFSHSFMFEIQ
ncbi:MAG: hypothetical protein V1891_00460 [bacterium]